MKDNLIKIAAIGDVHDQWEEQDNLALQHLGVDLVLFVGDFGNEAVDIVKIIASLDLPFGVILGNHDAWYSASAWGQKKCPYDRSLEDRVQQQLDLLGDHHVGYGKLDFEHLNLSVVGSRPFSWGGLSWRNEKFYRDRFGVNGFDDSVNRIVTAARETSCNNIIFLGHNGPLGLGDKREDICGRDWNVDGGDYGDPDFARAIAATKNLEKNIPLVIFGHMHHDLKHTKTRLRTMVNRGIGETIYFNCARVPRIVETDNGKLRNFSLISLDNGVVSGISLVWLGDDFSIVSEEILYQGQFSLQSVL